MSASLSEDIEVVERELAAATAGLGTYGDDPRSFHTRHRAAMEGLAAILAEKVGARITSRWDGARVRIGGVSSTSTGGISGALHNWIVAAKKRVQP